MSATVKSQSRAAVRRRAWVADHKARGLCTECNAPAWNGYSRCEAHHRNLLRRNRTRGGQLVLRVRRVTCTALLPAYQSTGAAGLDLHADTGGEPVVLYLGQRRAIRTGIAVEIPVGYEGQVRGRSGLAMRGFEFFVGTIDSDYRGEILVLLQPTVRPYELQHGERIAQLVIAPVARCVVEEASQLSETERGANGFGSTGTGA